LLDMMRASVEEGSKSEMDGSAMEPARASTGVKPEHDH
jgi:hypothetical protein